MTVTRLHGALVPVAQKTDVTMERTPALSVARGFSNPCTFCTSRLMHSPVLKPQAFALLTFLQTRQTSPSPATPSLQSCP